MTPAHMHASCIEQSAACLFHALAGLKGMTTPGADAGGTSAEKHQRQSTTMHEDGGTIQQLVDKTQEQKTNP